MGSPGDVSGHATAKVLGGSGTEEQNLVPLNPKTNLKQYHQVEKKIVKALREYGHVKYSLQYLYHNEQDTRPHTILYSFQYNNVVEKGSISNPEVDPPKKCS